MISSTMRPAVLPAATILAVTFLAAPLAATTWYVPSQCPTIQAGVDSAASGDTVEVACGTYYEASIAVKSGVTLRSETGDPACVVIDAQQRDRVMICDGSSSDTEIEGLTLSNGHRAGVYPNGRGGGLFLTNGALPTLRRCVFVGNSSDNFGGGLYSTESGPTLCECVFVSNSSPYGGGAVLTNNSGAYLEDCWFIDNSASVVGGGIDNAWSTSSSPTLRRCVFVGNHGEHGGGGLNTYYTNTVVDHCTFATNSAGTIEHGGANLLCDTGSHPLISNTIICFGLTREGVLCKAGGQVTLSCCDVYGNEGGDWVGAIAPQLGIAGNFCADPLFCDLGGNDFTLHAGSPCLPGNHPAGWDCGLIGALGQGCGPVALQPSTWALIKSRYR